MKNYINQYCIFRHGSSLENSFCPFVTYKKRNTAQKNAFVSFKKIICSTFALWILHEPKITKPFSFLKVQRCNSLTWISIFVSSTGWIHLVTVLPSGCAFFLRLKNVEFDIFEKGNKAQNWTRNVASDLQSKISERMVDLALSNSFTMRATEKF